MGVYWWCEMVAGWPICRWRGEWPAVGEDAICRRGCCRELSWVLVAIGDAQTALWWGWNWLMRGSVVAAEEDGSIDGGRWRSVALPLLRWITSRCWLWWVEVPLLIAVIDDEQWAMLILAAACWWRRWTVFPSFFL